MNTQQTNIIDGRVARAAEGLTTKGTKNTKKGQSIADGFKPGRLSRFLSSIVPELLARQYPNATGFDDGERMAKRFATVLNEG